MDIGSHSELSVRQSAPPAGVMAPKRRPKPLIRSAGIRFAMIYAVVFGVSAFALAFSLWYSTNQLLARQFYVAISNDSNTLLSDYQTGGLPALLDAITERMSDSADSDGLYLLLDPLGNRVTGTLVALPAGIDEVGQWYHIKVITRHSEKVDALIRAYALDGGYELLVGRDLRARAELGDVLSDGLLWAMGLMLALGIAGAVVIRSLFRRMIRDISTTTRAIASGDLSRRIAKTGDGDEFDELAEIINDMLERIARLMDGVRHVSNSIAHDLRTPITRARTRLEDASLHAVTEEDLRNAVDRATQDLDGIVGVFEALLRIAEIEAGANRAAFAAIDATPLLHDLDELYRAVAEERGLILETEIDAALPVLGDQALIQQAVANLLDNALKFSPPGSIIAFNAKLEDASIEIRIADRGAGISDADRERATERFFRAESARSTSGSGLGLALVSAVAQLHYGSLRLVNNHPGLCAIICLPARLDPLRASET